MFCRRKFYYYILLISVAITKANLDSRFQLTEQTRICVVRHFIKFILQFMYTVFAILYIGIVRRRDYILIAFSQTKDSIESKS